LSHLKCLLGFVLLATLGCSGSSGPSIFTVEPESPVVGTGGRLKIVAEPKVDLGGEIEWEVE